VRSLGSWVRAAGGGDVGRGAWLMLRPSFGLGGLRIRGLGGEDSRGAKTQERSDRCVRGDPGEARTDSQEDQGFEADEAGGTGWVPSFESRGTGKRALGCVKRDPIVAGGKRQLRQKRGRRGNRR
jgi:hypothetical protein